MQNLKHVIYLKDAMASSNLKDAGPVTSSVTSLCCSNPSTFTGLSLALQQ